LKAGAGVGAEGREFAAIPGEEVEGAIAADLASPEGPAPAFDVVPDSFCNAANLAGLIAESKSLSFSEGNLIDPAATVAPGPPERFGVPGPSEIVPPGIGEAVPLGEGEAFDARAFVVDKNLDL
jgi:hypothetical protein